MVAYWETPEYIALEIAKAEAQLIYWKIMPFFFLLCLILIWYYLHRVSKKISTQKSSVPKAKKSKEVS